MDIIKIYDLVINHLEELIETLPEEQRFVADKNTVLFGKNSSIDSLSLVSVIVDLETALSEEYGQDISLTDDRAMTREISPFSNVQNLAEYIKEILV